MRGIIGRKIGMTRIFDETEGAVIPITVVQAGTNVVHQVRNIEKDGYRAVQLGFDMISEDKVNKPLAGHFKKCESSPTRVIKEFSLDSDEEAVKGGQKVGVEIMENVSYVDVTAWSKGRGFTGSMKLWNFASGRESHGNTNRRSRGSLSSNTLPAHVFKGLRMAGRYGNKHVTIKGLELVLVDKEAGLLYIKGSIPGRNKGIVFVKKNVKKIS